MKNIIIALLLILTVEGLTAQTYFEPAAQDVYVPSKSQKAVRTATDVG